MPRNCQKCNRLWAKYTEALKRNRELAHSDTCDAQKAADEALQRIHKTLETHVALHFPEESARTELRSRDKARSKADLENHPNEL
jgi:hypothetical protein